MKPSNFEDNWRRRFTERGQLFDDDAAIAGWTDAGLNARLRNFARVWPGDRPGARWLDAGCGAGSYTRFLHARGMRVYGIDYSLPSVRKARARAAAELRWLVADVRRLPVHAAVADGVLCFGVMQALTAPEAALAELLRATRSGGQIWLDALNGYFLPTLFKRLLARWRGETLPLRYDHAVRLTRMLRELGAQEIRLYWVPILPAHWRRAQTLVETAAVRAIFQRVPFLAMWVSHAFVLSARRL